MTKKASFLSRADRILTRTATAVAAVTTAGMVSQPQEAQAAIIYSGPVNINIPTTVAGVYLNMVTGVAASTPGGSPGWDINPWGSSTLFLYANNGASPNDGLVNSLGSSTTLSDNLATGTLVDGALGYGRTNSIETTGATAFNLNSTNNYAGIRFLNESTGQYNFGWIQFSTAGTFNGQPRSIIAYAYENNGTGIRVGATGAAVPEPATLAVLAAEAAGLAVVRGLRRRRAATNAETAAA